ncbi:hypothetical protein BV22DRAFT_1039232 [Leucogyrophana mollusca]|uniref:Uncharacterized protein n=1 Tax=Leucogyrophana mollusca TaxID=85980 RepID=A0ACB8B6V7_9AGAM|nr:hypothetical protein BV22DRAFT_1039232 [Leucogyrophana mollusca]
MVEADVATDYGALLLGGLLAFGLSGCVNMQFIVYWRLYSTESWRTKSLVIATWLLDLCHSAFVGIALWDSIIVPYGDLSKLDTIPWSVGPAVELTAMVTFLVQSFFAYRIYRLNKKRWRVAGPVAFLAFVRLLAASISMGEMIHLKRYTDFVKPFPSWVFTLGLALSALVDIVITTFLCYFLRKNRTLISSTNRIIDLLTLYTVQNGSITCAAAIASLICWSVMPQNRIFLGLHFVVGKLYANSLLATLNARRHIRKSRHFNNPSSSNPLPIVFPDDFDDPTRRNNRGFSMRLDPFSLRAGNLKAAESIQVNVERTVESKVDNEGFEEEALPESLNRNEDSDASNSV